MDHVPGRRGLPVGRSHPLYIELLAGWAEREKPVTVGFQSDAELRHGPWDYSRVRLTSEALEALGAPRCVGGCRRS